MSSGTKRLREGPQKENQSPKGLDTMADFLHNKCRFDMSTSMKYGISLVRQGYDSEFIYDLESLEEFDDVHKDMPIAHRKRILKVLRDARPSKYQKTRSSSSCQSSSGSTAAQKTLAEKKPVAESAKAVTYINKAGYTVTEERPEISDEGRSSNAADNSSSTLTRTRNLDLEAAPPKVSKNEAQKNTNDTPQERAESPKEENLSQVGVCYQWRECGVCHTENCPFRHPKNTDENPIDFGNENIGEEFKVEEGPCFQWEKKGFCKWGLRCKYKHDKSIAGTIPICDSWKNTGACKFGDQCRFRHASDGSTPDLEPEHKRKVFVGGLPQHIKDEELKALFNDKVGDVSTAFVIKDKWSGGHRGFGFVTFSSPDSVEKALQQSIFGGGRKLDVKRVRARD